MGWSVNSARGWSVKCFEQSRGLDTVLYKNIPFSQRRDGFTQSWLIMAVLLTYSMQVTYNVIIPTLSVFSPELK